MQFPRQKYWGGLLSPPGDLPHPQIKPTSALADGFFTSEPSRKTQPQMSTVPRGVPCSGVQDCHLICSFPQPPSTFLSIPPFILFLIHFEGEITPCP